MTAVNKQTFGTLAAAAKWGLTDIAKALIARGAEVNAKTAHLVTPLFTALDNNHTEMVSTRYFKEDSRKANTYLKILLG